MAWREERVRTRVVVPALVVAVVLALVVGITLGLSSRGSGSGDRGVVVADRGTATVAPAAPVARVAPPVAPPVASRRTKVAARPVLARRPSIVLVLMDDFSLDLVDTMRSAETMRRAGADYAHAFVVDSLCCVSRASLLTGQYPHQTGVLTNTANTPNPVGPVGGWEAFEAYGNEERSFPVRLQQHGYTTGFVGKFLNQYEIHDGVAAAGAAGLGRLAGAVRRRLPGLGLPEHPTGRRTGPGRRASAAVRLGDGRREGRGLRRQRHR